MAEQIILAERQGPSGYALRTLTLPSARFTKAAPLSFKQKADIIPVEEKPEDGFKSLRVKGIASRNLGAPVIRCAFLGKPEAG